MRKGVSWLLVKFRFVFFNSSCRPLCCAFAFFLPSPSHLTKKKTSSKDSEKNAQQKPQTCKERRLSVARGCHLLLLRKLTRLTALKVIRWKPPELRERSPSLRHREKAVGIYTQYILLASRYVFSKYILLYQVLIMYNIHVKKYRSFALRSPFFFPPFRLFFFLRVEDETVHINALQVSEIKSTVLFFF